MFPFPALVGDIGGTNARFAVVDTRGGAPRHLARIGTGDHADAVAALKEALAGAGGTRPRSILLAGAGPLDGRRLELTNAGWTLDGARIAEALQIEQGIILNDFEAQALALTVLDPADFVAIGEVQAGGVGTRLALGPGTGLGVAALVPVEGRMLPVATEAGHIGFGPGDETEAVFWPHLERVDGRITAESVISGSGLLRVHKARLAAAGRSDGLDTPQAVSDAALDGSSEDARASVTAFWRLIARFAGDMAVTFIARGGVCLMGGVAPRLLPLLDAEAFRAVFAAKAPMASLAASVPTAIVTDTGAALHALAGLAANPDYYLLDYEKRLWR